MEPKKKAKKGHKFVKMRVLHPETGDLVWDLVEVPEKDRRKAFDPKTQAIGKKNEAMTGNPMANSSAGVGVTGL